MRLPAAKEYDVPPLGSNAFSCEASEEPQELRNSFKPNNNDTFTFAATCLIYGVADKRAGGPLGFQPGYLTSSWKRAADDAMEM